MQDNIQNDLGFQMHWYMGCEPYKALPLYLHLVWNCCYLQAYHHKEVTNCISNILSQRKLVDLKGVNHTEDVSLSVNATYFCFGSPSVAKIHVSLWQFPLSEEEKMS